MSPFEIGDRVKISINGVNPEYIDRIFTVNSCDHKWGEWYLKLDEMGNDVFPHFLFTKANDRKNRIENLYNESDK